MLHEIFDAAMRRLNEQEAVIQLTGAVVFKQGGRIEIPIATITGGLAIEVGEDEKVVILRILSEEEVAKERAMAESAFQEKH